MSKTAAGLVPTKKEAIEAGRDLGAVALGIIACHAGLNVIKKQNSALINGGLLVGGAYGVMKVKHPFLRALCLGAGVYGGIKLLGIGANAVTTPGATEGLSGILPEGVKSAIRKYIPTFSGIDEVAGTDGYEGTEGTGNADLDNLSLDDQGFEGAEDNGDFAGDEDNYSGASVGNLAA